MAVTIPRNDHRAVWYFLIGLGLGILTDALYPAPHHTIRYSLGFLLGTLIMSVPIGLVCWAVWRGHYWAKALVIAVTLYGFARPLLHFSELRAPQVTPRFVLLMVSLTPRLAAVGIIARDLLRRP
ncbi:hypothetical protein [Hymenobacter metallilatus]|uniref:Uncharacterized protein n=1 Tax=Hymenobacter metallilatus TaxID=2493666 RepID=A0A3R9M8P3_9BACT|nr:hypothetical protein [Hymenobacter metallilatus]RSK33054.1 hypothetical protein EI290_10070 [Hymenobacter metallilatus]